MLRKQFIVAGIPLFLFATANAQIRHAKHAVPVHASTKTNQSHAGHQPNTRDKRFVPAPRPTGALPLPTTIYPAPRQTGPFGQQISPAGPLRMTSASWSFGSAATQQTIIMQQRSIANSYPFQQYSLSNSISLQPRRLQIAQIIPLTSCNAQQQGFWYANPRMVRVNGHFNPMSQGFSNGRPFNTGAFGRSTISFQPFVSGWASSAGFGRFNNTSALFAQQQFDLDAFQAGGVDAAPLPPSTPDEQPAATTPGTTQQLVAPVAPRLFPTQTSGGVGPVPRE